MFYVLWRLNELCQAANGMGRALKLMSEESKASFLPTLERILPPAYSDLSYFKLF